jgi:hypothetical protein
MLYSCESCCECEFTVYMFTTYLTTTLRRLILMVSLVYKLHITSVDAAVHLGFSLQVTLPCVSRP